MYPHGPQSIVSNFIVPKANVVLDCHFCAAFDLPLNDIGFRFKTALSNHRLLIRLKASNAF